MACMKLARINEFKAIEERNEMKRERKRQLKTGCSFFVKTGGLSLKGERFQQFPTLDWI